MIRHVAFVFVFAGLLVIAAPVRATDEPDELMPGTLGTLVPLDHIRVRAEGGPFDLPDPSNDPTVEGGTVRFFDTAPGGDDETYPLPAINWSSDPMGGFEYNALGNPTPTAPCVFVRLFDDLIDIRCVGAGVTITPPLAGDLGMILTIGTDSKEYCVSMGGTTTKNNSSKFERHDSMAPGTCPTPPTPLPELLPGKVVVIKQAKLAKFVAKPASGETFDLPPNPVNPITTGAVLRMRDLGATGGDQTFLLPAGPKWKQTGKSGYKYSGTGQAGDPCRVVLIKTRVIKAVCVGTDITLDHTAFSGDVAVKLTTGSGPTKRYCAQYGGDDVSATTNLRRKNAPAPNVADCPSPSGAFLEVGAGLFD